MEEINWMFNVEIQKRRPSMDLLVICKQFEVDGSDTVYKWLNRIFDNKDTRDSRGQLAMHDIGKLILDKIDDLYFKYHCNNNKGYEYMNRYEILINGYLKWINNTLLNDRKVEIIPNIIYKQCENYYNPSVDPHINQTHLSYLSVIKNGFDLNLYDMKLDKLYNVNIKNIDVDNTTNINQQSILFMVKNASIPLWILDQYQTKLTDSDTNICKSDKDLSLLFVKSVEYDNFVIIIDNKYENGYNFQIPSGTDIVSEMYSYSNTNILCIDDENEICDYNIDLDEYNKFNISGESYHGKIPKTKLDSIGYGLCSLQNGQKMFKCGGLNIKQSKQYNNKYVKYSYFKNAEIINLNHDTLSGTVSNDINSMIIPRAYFNMMYIDRLQQIIAGPGGQSGAISCNIIEIYDIIKNKWNVIDVKTNYDYQSVVSLNENKNKQSSLLWSDIHNPFIINLCNGKNFAEFIDIRQQKEWKANEKLNNYLGHWNEKHVGHLLI